MQRRAVVISIGDELLTGAVVDTNGPWIANQLALHGWTVVRGVVIGDDRSAIAHAVRSALDGAELVILTGGLGPTADDVTREGVADAFGVDVREDEEARRLVEAFFRTLGRPLSPSQYRQMLIPDGCEVVPNPWGTAPAFRGRRGQARVFALPGVPSEMRSIFEASVLATLGDAGAHRRTVTDIVRCFGASEAVVGERIADLMTPGRHPSVGITVSGGVIGIRVRATGDDEDAARARLESDVTEITARLGRLVFGRGDATLERAVGRRLTEIGSTIATAESCTGGLLATLLTDVPGSSDYFLRGCVTYSNASKRDLLGVGEDVLAEHGAVSEPVARAMAIGCRERAGADVAVSTTGIAGPSGGTAEKPVGLVYLGYADGREVIVRRVLFGAHLSRGDIRTRACRAALNLVRLRLDRSANGA